jgi:hypothetical protein
MAVPIREIVYTLSPYNNEVVMKGVQKLPGKITKYFKNVSLSTAAEMPFLLQVNCSRGVFLQNWLGLTIFNTVLFGPIV